jgi:aminopeptidase-like protein
MTAPPFATAREATAQLAERALALVKEICPLPRSITGEGVRATLRCLERVVPLEWTEVPSGTPVLDWEVPPEWTLRAATITDPAGRRVVDVARHPLHIVGYSIPVRARMPLGELRAHLHTLPERPDDIPYRTSYYHRTWGFCLPHRELATWAEGEYEVVIDAELAPGSLTLAECVVPGRSASEVLVYTHSCHPGMANDNAAGLAVAALLAAQARATQPNLTYRFVFGPGTIGSIAWLALRGAHIANIRAGLVVGLLGDDGPLTYKRSRRGRAEVDLIAAQVICELDERSQVLDFSPYGYDERQFCSPGFDLPVGRLTRSPHGAYPEYHTSADAPGLLRAEALAESLCALGTVFNRMDANPRYRSTQPFGEPRLGARGLFRTTGGTDPDDFEHAMLWLLNMADGQHGLADTQAASGLPPATLQAAADALMRAGLLERVD